MQDTNTIIQVNQLSRQFGEQAALDNISFKVKAGQIFGIVGENGAGKTTLIKHILGQYIAEQGSIKVFGKDPVEEPEKVLAKIGYLSEEPDLPAWMTVKEIIKYTAAFYANWDHRYAAELMEVFSLQTNKRIRELSKGQKARVGLVLAQAHRPELLLLDEPSSGLDPNVRRDILGAIIRTVSEEGRSVIFSSHLLEEVERVSDHLMMLDKGKRLLSDSMDNILAHHYRFVISGNNEINTKQLRDDFKNLGLLNSQQLENEWLLNFYGDEQQIEAQLNDNTYPILSKNKLSLSDIFIARTTANKGG
ncbi:MAG: ABC transporter ATP-binding protein [Enterobacterales bacterium]|nr:ABC transporter ATP-binding protein [Enterobacterales bacterium]